jgi:hypothetical protein
MVIYKTFLRRDVVLEKRDQFSLSCLERTKVKNLSIDLIYLADVKKQLEMAGKYTEYKKACIIRQVRLIHEQLRAICCVNENLINLVPKRAKYERRNIQSFVYQGYIFSERFRFRSADQLISFLDLFRFPTFIRTKTSVFHREELLLISLMRLAYPNRWCDVVVHFPGRIRPECHRAFYWFLDFMIVNWGYLITNNREYWTNKLPHSAEAIRLKLASLPNVDNRLSMGSAHEPGGFNVALFIGPGGFMVQFQFVITITLHWPIPLLKTKLLRRNKINN